MHLYQVEVSKISCKFIRVLAEELSAYYPQYKQIINLFFFKDDDSRYVLPCYLTMDIQLKYMEINNIPILLSVFLPQKKPSQETSIANILCNLREPNKLFSEVIKPAIDYSCVIFRGVSSLSKPELLNELLNLGVKNVLLASTARHPQYPGKNLNHLKSDPFSAVLKGAAKKEECYLSEISEKFQFVKAWSLEHGCCFENFSTFFVTHIYCDKLSNYIFSAGPTGK